MKIKSILLLALSAMLVVALPALAQPATNSVAFNGVSFQFPSTLATNVSISQHPGDPVDLDAPGGPQAPYTDFLLYNTFPAPESIFDAGGIRVYRTADFAQYPDYQQAMDALAGLTSAQADLTPSMAANAADNSNKLPFLPVVPANQVIRARARYVGNATFSGIAYVTVFRQDASPFVGTEFLYTVQGVSSDGSYYVSAIFPLTTALFPDSVPADFNYDSFIAGIDQYTNESIATLNAAAPTEFTPGLETLDAVVSSLMLTSASAPGVPVPAQPTPTSEPTAIADPTFGGLGGTWILTGWGDVNAPTAPLEGSVVNVNFGAEGISGSSGCNSYSGGFQYNNGVLVVQPLATTLMACEQPVMDQEGAFLNALQGATGYQINGDMLTLFYDGGVLTFSRAAEG